METFQWGTGPLDPSSAGFPPQCPAVNIKATAGDAARIPSPGLSGWSVAWSDTGCYRKTILLDLVRLHFQQSVCRFSIVESPPLETGTM
ncbi:hypothetical protein ACFFX0_14205 [Citricoccus parietis]|uniref:Uncharacterized protein n=1 Tax=Citricoccus parietis TaxID=592307 RepID=A0ABV5G043_9MICC